MKTSLPILTGTVKATGPVLARRFVSVVGAQAGAAANTAGVARTDAAAGDNFPVDVLGTAVVVAGGPIPAGAAVETDADGRAVVHTTGPVVARLVPGETAQAAGDPVEVVLIPN